MRQSKITAQKLISEIQDIDNELLPLYERCMILMEKRTRKMNHLSSYKSRGIITEKEMPRLQKITAKQLFNKNKE